jgi:hypothetical protein
MRGPGCVVIGGDVIYLFWLAWLIDSSFKFKRQNESLEI